LGEIEFEGHGNHKHGRHHSKNSHGGNHNNNDFDLSGLGLSPNTGGNNAGTSINKSGSSMSLLGKAKTNTGLSAVFEHDNENESDDDDVDDDDLGDFDTNLTPASKFNNFMSPNKQGKNANGRGDESDEEVEEEDEDDEDYDDGEITNMDAFEFDKMMDEMSEKKKTNVHDDKWNKIIAQTRLPAITALAEHCNDDLRIRFATFDSIGLRPYMEDRIFACGDLTKEYFKPYTRISTTNTQPAGASQACVCNISAKQAVQHLKMAYFGVYDGHNGYYVAEYLQKVLHRTLYEMIACTQQAQTHTKTEPIKNGAAEPGHFISSCWMNACITTDREIIYNDFKRQSAGLHSGTLAMEVFGGSVAAMCLLVEDATKPASERLTAYMAWVGDCRAVISDHGVS
jgi:hypothetical protein